MQLLYTTSSRSFWELARLKLNGEDIAVHATDVDPATTTVGSPFMPREYRIYLVNEDDYVRANQLLLEIGAAREEPAELPSGRWVRWLLLSIGLLIAALAMLSA
jgi:hypothetical protein